MDTINDQASFMGVKKRREKPKSFISPRYSARFKIILVFYLAWFFLGTMIVVNNLYAIDQMTNQIEEYNERILTLYINQIDDNLRNLNVYLYNQIANDANLPVILSAQASISVSDRVIAASRFNLSSRGTLWQYPWLHSLFVLTEDAFYVESYLRGAPSIRLKNELRSLILESDEVDDFGKWKVNVLDGEYYIVNIIPMGGGHMCALIAIKDLMMQMEMLDEAFTQKVLLVSSDGEVIHGDATVLPVSTIEFPYKSGAYEQYAVTRKQSSRADFELVTVYDVQLIRQNLPSFTIIIVIIIVSAFLMGALFFVLLRRIILKPLKELQRVTGNILSGDMSSRIENLSNELEFYETNKSLNAMLNHIEELHIKVYDEQLENQQLELEKLQHQIKPHFLLNALNLIYNMAQEKDFSLIQKACLSLSQYFRYRVNATRNIVPLIEEIKCAEDYFAIQKLRYTESFEYVITLQQGLEKTKIVPFMILSFVENSIKYALIDEKKLMITVTVKQISYGGELSVYIEITDNGPGFPDEIIDIFKKDMDAEVTGVGIRNIRRRLNLVYGNRARIILSNNEGAHVVIMFPAPREGQDNYTGVEE